MGERITVDAATINELGIVLSDLSTWIALRATMAVDGSHLRLEDAPATDAYRRLVGDWELTRKRLCATLDGLAERARTAGAAYVEADSRAGTLMAAQGSRRG